MAVQLALLVFRQEDAASSEKSSVYHSTANCLFQVSKIRFVCRISIYAEERLYKCWWCVECDAAGASLKRKMTI